MCFVRASLNSVFVVMVLPTYSVDFNYLCFSEFMNSVSGEAYLYFWLAVEVCYGISTDSSVRGLVISVIGKSEGSSGCRPSSSPNPIAKW